MSLNFVRALVRDNMLTIAIVETLEGYDPRGTWADGRLRTNKPTMRYKLDKILHEINSIHAGSAEYIGATIDIEGHDNTLGTQISRDIELPCAFINKNDDSVTFAPRITNKLHKAYRMTMTVKFKLSDKTAIVSAIASSLSVRCDEGDLFRIVKPSEINVYTCADFAQDTGIGFIVPVFGTKNIGCGCCVVNTASIKEFKVTTYPL